MQKHVLSCLGAVFALTACSSSHERQIASGEFEYLQEAKTISLKVPEGKETPKFSRDYELPKLGERAPTSLVGPKLTVVSPQLVLPLVSGSHITEGSQEAVIWFDQIDDSQALDTTIWNSLLSFLEEQGIGVVEFDKDKQLLLSDWMIIEDNGDSSWYSWTKTERSVGQRFEFNLEVKPHGRTAALKVRLKDYLETINDEVVGEIDHSERRRNEVEVLNKVISHYAKQIRIADARRLRQIQQGLSMELGFNAGGEPAFVVDASYDITWPRILLVLRKLGFNVKDLDQSNGLLFVSYSGVDSSWWSDLWGGTEELTLEKTDYRFILKEQGQKTSITLQNNEGETLPSKTLTEIFQPMSEVMATDNLDI
ncbi:outer membrane protein assembly factor BamC [Alteromonas sp. a30]|uniref:outer membrane protein assembly factor BamC n=1 Tax=Alteromonas sp. a30 TaxID=2730917 RepID=UPI00227DA8B9|nr:outer membrane protein assembly factor BamC [Alteromonas sp. a30]MCY7294096.1 outer membrane protein assembly factor BamC [Alteromonas sp. a30]